MSETTQNCPKCGKLLAENLLEGLCPECLMIAAMETAGISSSGSDPSIEEKAGEKIDRYKLLEQIGEGGFGVVFMAEQVEPVRRRVALKVIKPGMDSKQVIARFEAERQALALMNHENIARVFDAGTTNNGRPYFVMELVRGVPITHYCDVNKLAPRNRLELMIQICRAIQHAHQKGIIHRDIKPSNVLVTLYDGRPVPKVIDFGVAKAIQQPLTDKTMFTRFGQVMGTLEYMSPEQAEMSGLDIDTRGDVYSLGVLLYELLTGSTPLDRKRLNTVAIDEVLRLIRDEEPQRPSLRLEQSGDQKQSICSQRGVAPEKMDSILRGELDWIAMKSLEKERTRRYESANELAADLQRFLDNEPVQAAPPSPIYRFRKLIRKNRTAFLFTATVAASLLIGLITTILMYLRSEQLRETADHTSQELATEQESLRKALDDAREQRKARTQALREKDLALKKSVKALNRSQALRLAAVSALQREKDPGLALTLAFKALQLEPVCSEAMSSLTGAMEQCHEINTHYFENPIRDGKFSEDFSRVVTRSQESIDVWDVHQGTKISTIRLPTNLGLDLFRLSPDGKKIVMVVQGWRLFRQNGKPVVALTDRVVRFLDVETSQETMVLRGHTDKIVSFEFSPDGREILTASADGTARLWSVESGQQIRKFEYDEKQCNRDQRQLDRIKRELDSRKNKNLSLAGARFQDGKILLVPLNGQVESRPFYKGRFDDQKIEKDPALSEVASFDYGGGGVGGNNWLFGGKPCAQVFEKSTAKLTEVLKTREGRSSQSKPGFVAIPGPDEVAVIEKTRFVPKTLARLKSHRNGLADFGVDHQGEFAYTLDSECIRIWRVEPIGFKQALSGNQSGIECVDISPDGEFIAAGTDRGFVIVWRARDGKLVSRFRRDYEFLSDRNRGNYSLKILQVCFSPDGSSIATLSEDRAIIKVTDDDKTERLLPTENIRVWDWRKKKLLQGWSRQHRFHDRLNFYTNYSSIGFSGDGKFVVAADNSNHAKTNLRSNGRFTGSRSIDGWFRVKPGDKNSGPELSIRSWNVETGKPGIRVVGKSPFRKPRLSRNGQFAVVSEVNGMKVIETRTGERVGRLSKRFCRLTKSLLVSPRGHKCFAMPHRVDRRRNLKQAVLDEDGNGTELIATFTAEQLEVLHDQPISCAAFSHDEVHLAFGMANGWVASWNTQSNTIEIFRAHGHAVNDIVFSADDRYFATVAQDRMARVWETKTNRKYMEVAAEAGWGNFRKIRFEPNSRFLIACGGARIQRWPLNPMEVLRNFKTRFPAQIPRRLNERERDQYGLPEKMSGFLEQR